MYKIRVTNNALTISNCGGEKCQLPLTNEGIGSDTCDKWSHSRCIKLTKSALKFYGNHYFLKWVCINCTTIIKRSQTSDHIIPGKATIPKTRFSKVVAPPSTSNDCVSTQQSWICAIFEMNNIAINSLNVVAGASLSPLPELGSPNSDKTSPVQTQAGIADGVLVTLSEINPVGFISENPIIFGTSKI